MILATGKDFPDALSIASYAAQNEIPILLTEKNQVPMKIQDFINNADVGKTYIIGGTGVISEKVEQQVPNPERIAGSDRYETNFKVLSQLDYDYSRTFFATGTNFPDALAGSALAGLYGSPIVLLSELSASRSESWEQMRDQMKMKYILGAEGAVPSSSIQRFF